MEGAASIRPVLKAEVVGFLREYCNMTMMTDSFSRKRISSDMGWGNNLGEDSGKVRGKKPLRIPKTVNNTLET